MSIDIDLHNPRFPGRPDSQREAMEAMADDQKAKLLGLALDLLWLPGAVLGCLVAYVVGFQVAAWLASVWADGAAAARIALWVALSPLMAFCLVVLLGVATARAVSPRRQASGLIVVTCGGAAAALSAVGLIAWSEARLGDWNLALTGITSALPLVTSVLGLSLAVRPLVNGIARIAFGIAAAVVTFLGVVIVVTNGRGLLDGLSPAAPLLGVSLASFSVLAVVGFVLAFRNRGRSSRIQ